MLNSAKQPLGSAARQAWLLSVASDQKSAFIAKFVAGEIEHQGDIGDVPFEHLLAEVQQEALDTLAYVAELRRRVNHGGVVIINRDALEIIIGYMEEHGREIAIPVGVKAACQDVYTVLKDKPQLKGK